MSVIVARDKRPRSIRVLRSEIACYAILSYLYKTRRGNLASYSI